MKNLLISSLLIILFSACQKTNTLEKNLGIQKYTEEQQDIIDKYLNNCAYTFNYTFNHHQYQNCLDKGLNEDPTISYLWQQKSMPYFKARKYEVGMTYLDKAVEINPMRYLSYRAFIKCIFSKDYSEAIEDFDAIKALEGNSIVMDHSYDFYTALSYLQLNEFDKAETLFNNDIEAQEEEWGSGEYHFLSMFYYAVTLHELEKWEASVDAFNKTLEKYPNFSEAHYYKSVSLTNLKKLDEATESYALARENSDKGNTISEDNSLYELYPYQLRWH